MSACEEHRITAGKRSNLIKAGKGKDKGSAEIIFS
jgi:hypothetical protein